MHDNSVIYKYNQRNSHSFSQFDKTKLGTFQNVCIFLQRMMAERRNGPMLFATQKINKAADNSR